MSQTISGVFLQPEDAERAIGALEDHGIARDRISAATMASDDAPPNEVIAGTPAESPRDGFMDVTVEDPPTPTDMNAATEARLGGSGTSSPTIEAEGKAAITTTTAADAAKGAAEGAAVGLSIGLLAGVAMLTVPPFGIILAAGPLWTALAGAAGATAAGAMAGGVTGYLRDMGVPEKAATHLAEALSKGSILVSVRVDTPGDTVEAENMLLKYGATHITIH